MFIKPNLFNFVLKGIYRDVFSHFAQAAERCIHRQREQVVHELLKGLGEVCDAPLVQLQAEQDAHSDAERERPGSSVNLHRASFSTPLTDFTLYHILKAGQIALQCCLAEHFRQDLRRRNNGLKCTRKSGIYYV